MKSHDLMRLLIPDNKVKDVAQFTNLHTSLLYQERREAGKALNQTGTRNTIDRLDLFCEYALGHNPEAVRIVGERYVSMYQNYISTPPETVTVNDLLVALGEAGRECGEATAVIASRQSISKCTIEVAQAKEALERALSIVAALECSNG